MKTKIMVGGLLAALMLVIVPVIAGSITETTEEVTSVLDVTTHSEEITEEVTPVKETTVEEPIVEENKIENTKYFRFGYISVRFSDISENDIEFKNGLLFTKNIVINSPARSLTKSLKINGQQIVESKTPVKLEINLMGNLGFRLRLTSIIGWTQRFQLGLSGFAMGIKVTY